jgi:2-keto-4-pentenoate hydratase/2-oxohepta-3-ene-1,7-dioic acid hydratase in catechol pathway
MRIVRFTAPAELGVGSDPLFGLLNESDSILILKGDPIYAGITPIDKTLNLADVKLLAPVIPRSKVVCIGKNYADHAAEMDSAVPDEPIIFIKPNNCDWSNLQRGACC